MSKKRRWIPITLGVLAIGISAGLYAISHSASGPKTPAGGSAVSALQFKATKEDISKSIEVKGKSSYVSETVVYPPFDGSVLKWQVAEGGQVKKGDLLFQLDDSLLKADIELQQANMRKQELEMKLKEAQDTLQANDPQAAGAAAPGSESLKRFGQEELRKMQDELDALSRKTALKQLEEKKEKVAKASLLSPVDGIFLFADKKEPPKLEEKTAVGKIVDLTKLQLTTTVSEYEVYQIKAGMDVEVRADALPDMKLAGKVERISKFAKSGTDTGGAAAQFEVVVSLEPNEKLIAGLSLTGKITADKKQGALVIPTIAVQRDKEQAFVYMLGAQGSERKPVTIGMETSDKTEVTSGLNEGDTVVLQ
ncbi:efflux RND transporter periplasmic adaptor subunit [Paenibacillus sp. MBLB4367]|uniref:efflux RND transporter periplasmic adaptor subunit n=1 Tax=Paenibacillus sp. MBLB4367 TaxID=3384767 RepID=UPI0039082E36